MDELRKRASKLLGVYVGIVEDREDPDKMGRVKARVWGIHNEELPVSKLQWFIPAYPITAAQKDGIGDSGLPEIGSSILVLFVDGDIMQGVYFGVLGRIGGMPNPDAYLENTGHRQIKTPSGHIIETTDKIVKITADDGATIIEINNGNISVKAPNGKVSVEAKEITLQDGSNIGDVLINHQKFLQYIHLHQHPTGVGPSGTVLVATSGLKNNNDWYTTTIKVKS